MTLAPPFTPENYIKAITVCEEAGMEVIIIDSISHEWDELLDFHSKLAGNSFTNWAKVTPRQKAFVDKILQTNAHVIATMRTKQDYVLNQKDGKFIPEKVGLKSVQRDGVDYEFTLVFDIDIKHFAVSSKDRTGLFMGKPEFIVSEQTGRSILEWCNSVVNSTEYKNAERASISSINKFSSNNIVDRIQESNTVAELLALYNMYPEYQQILKPHYESRKSVLNTLSKPQNITQNGKN